MKKIFSILILLVCALQVSAHEGGHGAPAKVWHFTNSDMNLKAEFIEKIDNSVYLMNDQHKVVEFNISEFTTEEQQYILEKANWINAKNTLSTEYQLFSINYSKISIYVGVALLLFTFFRFRKKNSFQTVTLGLIGITIIFTGCKTNVSSEGIKMAKNDV